MSNPIELRTDNPPERSGQRRSKRYLVNALIDTHDADDVGSILGWTDDWGRAMLAARRHAESWFGAYLLEGASIMTLMDDNSYLGTVFQIPPTCPACDWTARSVGPIGRPPGRILNLMSRFAHRDVVHGWNHLHDLPGPKYRPWWVLPSQIREWPEEAIAHREQTDRPLLDLDLELPRYMRLRGDASQ
ncbi:hypothetical protein [Nocardioides zhouii]|uniref:Uncharacterized protein n=1 Tax=Nocardioides zhouii TaxID=1168729 RepID=A0A4Q2T6A0_9ACTN|nr:hypothetical protein [Nocardioides zhouii]RYC12478.1 hypothetical protein EUA94_07335 [Nocardioides zhouii]